MLASLWRCSVNTFVFNIFTAIQVQVSICSANYQIAEKLTLNGILCSSSTIFVIQNSYILFNVRMLYNYMIVFIYTYMYLIYDIHCVLWHMVCKIKPRIKYIFI